MANIDGFKPCPFCGGTSFWITPKEHFSYLTEKYGGVAVRCVCDVCEVDMWNHSKFNTYEERIDALRKKWNGRVCGCAENK